MVHVPCFLLSRKSRQQEHNLGCGTCRWLKGLAQIILSQSEVSRVISFARRLVQAAKPEKTDCVAKAQLGFGTAKAVIASGAVAVHASTLLDFLAEVGG